MMNGQEKTTGLPPFLISSAPKSGTHLLHQIMLSMPNVTNNLTDSAQCFFIDHHVKNTSLLENHMYRLGLLKPNQFGFAHLFYSDQYAYMLRRLNMKHIFLYRDPRDILISLAYFIPTGWVVHPFNRRFIESETTIKQRCMTLLRGQKDIWPDFDAWNRPFFNWFYHTDTFSVSYEQLMSIKTRRDTLTGILSYLWEGQRLPISLNEMVARMENAFEPSRSRTFRKGKINSWQEEFDEDLKREFKKLSGDLLIEFGYEQDHNW